MTPAPTLSDLIATVQADAGGGDDLDALTTASSIAQEMEGASDALLGHFVDRCRRQGRSWTEISAALGVTKQAAHRRFRTGPPTLERFTPRARQALTSAESVARELGHATLGTEHLLVALFDDPDAISAKILERLGMRRAAVAEAVLADFGAGAEAVTGAIPYRPEAAEALQGALAEALALGHNYIGTEHLLLSLFRDPQTAAARLLAAAGATHDLARDHLADLLAAYRQRRPPNAAPK